MLNAERKHERDKMRKRERGAKERESTIHWQSAQ